MAKQYGEGSDSNALVKKQLEEQQQKKDKRTKQLKLGVGIALIVVAAILMVVNGFKANKINAENEKLEADIVDLQAQLEGVSKKASETDAKQVKENVYSAQETGNRICEIQNELSNVSFEMAPNGEFVDEAKMNELLAELRKYIPNSSDTSAKAREIWCYGHKWYFNSNYAMSLDTYPVVFTCYQESDVKKEKLLAYAIAYYNVDSDTFSPVKLYNTSWLSMLTTGLPDEDEGAATSTDAASPTDTTENRDEGSHILDIVNQAEDSEEDTSEEDFTPKSDDTIGPESDE